MLDKINSIKKLKGIKGKRIIVRTDFNVPISNDKVRDGFRIDKSFETIDFLSKKGAKVILVSHIGDSGEATLKPVYEYLKKKIKITFSSEVLGEKTTELVSKMKNGEIILLENLRKDPGEAVNSKILSIGLSSLADIYVNEAFSASHREHSSIVGLPRILPHFCGILFENEVKMLSKVSKENKHPFLFILGGAKFGTKIPLLKKFLPKSDHVFITGALSNNFFLNDGYPVGKSLIDKDSLPQIKNINTKANMKKIYLPEDVVATSNGKNRTCLPSEVKDSEMIVDIGDRTIEEMKLKIQNAKMILWNGPTSAYEMGYVTGTTELLKEISKSKAMRVIGGGDTAALITKLKLGDKLGFVSTGGGAMLDFLAKGTLPGIKALK